MGFPRRIHCVGIGGIGLSALAQYLAYLGHEVTGSDREASRVTDLLRERGVPVAIGHDAALALGADLVIYSAAVPEENPERSAAAAGGIPQISYFEALGRATEGKRLIAVSGTHGKTTTTAMIARILRSAGYSPTAIVGSLVIDFGSNFLPGGSDVFVAEACEYKRHFHNLSPEVLVVTNLELDHTDYYKDIDDLADAFRAMAAKVPRGGRIVADTSSQAVRKALAGAPASVVEYAGEKAPALQLIGEFNSMNARAAKAAVRAFAPEIAEEIVDAALRDFKGTWRRFESKGKTKEGALVFDDYAHHPTAIMKTLRGARERFPGKRLTVVFHPHLYSRTKSLLAGFSKAFADADSVIIAPIYAAREKPDPSISHTILAERIRGERGEAYAADSFEEIEKRLRETCGERDIIITMGAGDIYKMAERLTD